MQTIKSRRIVNIAVIGVLLVASIVPVISSRSVHAATLSQALVRFDRMKVSTATTGTVCVKPTTALVENDVQVTYPAGYTLGAVGTFTVSTANLSWPAGALAWLGINTATNVTGQVVTFPSTDLVVGSLYCFNWINTAAVQVKAGATSSNSGTLTTRDVGLATIDTASYSSASITDDQIAVSATVPQSFSFALSANTDPLGTLATGSVITSPTPRTVTVNTNAKNGWFVWAKDANTGLTSASSSYTVASTTPGSNATLVSGTEGYNLGVTTSQTSGTGTLAPVAGFLGGSLGKGGGLDTTLRSVASSNGSANNAVVTLNNNAAIQASTPAATDYADTITVVGAGLF